MIRKILLMLSLVLVLLPDISDAKDMLSWQKVNWPPYQIIEGKDAGEGRFDQYNKLFQEQLPQYEHQNVEMNWSRFWKDVEAGKHVLNSMAIKTDERSQIAAFSQIMSFALPHRIIMKRSTFEKMGKPESVALADFIRDTHIHGILEQKRSYSTQLDDILNKGGVNTNFERKAIDVKHIFKMILADRADYTIEYPVVVDYLLNRHNTGEDSSLSSVRIEELPRYIPVRIAAPKTPWGVAVINDIDKMIDGIKKTPRFLEIQKMYHSDPRELDEVQSIYEEIFLGKRPTALISGISQNETHAIILEVLKEAYKRIGYDVQFSLLPAKRSLHEANLGKSDGEIARIDGTEKDFPNLIAVSTPVIDFQGMVYTKSVTREIRNWSDLKGLKIGVIRGIRYSTIETKGMDPFFAEDMTHLFRLLMDGRIEVAVAGLRAGTIEIQRNFRNSDIHTVGQPLYLASMHHFVHKKNKDLVERLNHVLANMAARGEIDSIIDRTIQKRQDNE